MAGIEISLFGPDQWQVLRDLRLAALRDAPHAFLGSAELEQHRGQVDWSRECVDHRWLLAVVDDEQAGIAKILVPDDEHPHMESVWVDRRFRRRGVATALIRAAEQVVRADGHDALNLWVIGANEAARNTYASLGYLPVGRIKPLDHPGREEEEFTKKLA